VKPSPAAVALVLTGLAVLVTGVWAWLLVAAKAAVTWRLVSESTSARITGYLTSQGLSPRLPLIAWSPRRAVPWAFLDLVVVVGLYFVAAAVLQVAGFIPSGETETLDLAQKQSVIGVNILISLIVGAASIVLAVVRCGATGGDLGWSARTIREDLRLGSIGFVMLAPPVYALQGLLVNFWKKSEHPIIEMFKDAPDVAFFGLLFVSAAVVAPLFEELIFRVFLQGFLEKATSFRGNPMELLVGKTHELVDIDDEQPELRGMLAWLPITFSAGIFALLHYSHGPDWVPLLLLAAGMGYLYQRTHRMLPSLVVHTLLNALSMWGLWVEAHP
jgi:membrane protease YdiL (CAAX protease family)